MANSQFPGLDDVIKFLQDQSAQQAPKTPVPNMSAVPGTPLQAPASPLYSGAQVPGTGVPTLANEPISTLGKNVPAPTAPSAGAGQGIFNVAEGSGAQFLRNLLGKAASGAAIATLPLPGGSLASHAWDAGQGLASLATNTSVDRNGNRVKNDSPEGRRLKMDKSFDGSSLPDLGGPPLKVQSLNTPVVQKAPIQVQPTAAPRTITPSSYSAQLAGIDTGHTEDDPVQDATVETPALTNGQNMDVPAAEEETPAEEPADSTPAAKTEAAQVLDAISKQLDVPVKAPVQETPDKSSTDAVKNLTTPKPDAPETTGHKIKRFFVAGSGPLNFSRIDQQEAEAKQAKSKFTDPEALQADLARTDIGGTQKFNREAQLKQQETGGMNDADKLKMSTLLEQYKLASGDERLTSRLAQEHENKMAEIQATGANEKLSPEVMKQTALYKQMQEYPDLFSPDLFKKTFGVDVSPQALKVISDARLKNDPLAIATAEILKDRMDKMKASQVGAKTNLTTKALSK